MKTRKHLTPSDVIRFLTLHDPDLTAAQIQDRLEWLGLEKCTTFLITQIRGAFLRDLHFLTRLGLLNDRKPTIPSRIRNVRPPKQEPVRGSHYGRQSRDD